MSHVSEDAYNIVKLYPIQCCRRENAYETIGSDVGNAKEAEQEKSLKSPCTIEEQLSYTSNSYSECFANNN